MNVLFLVRSNLHDMSTLRVATECISYVEKDARASLGYPNPNPETTRAVHNAASGILCDCIDTGFV